MRMSPSVSSPSRSGARHSSVRPPEFQISQAWTRPFFASTSSRLPAGGRRWPTSDESLCAIATWSASTMAAWVTSSE